MKMVCTCEVEGVRSVEARRLHIFQLMGLDDMGDLTTAIILSLAFDFQADARIDADMWFGVWLTTPLLEKDLSIDCDWPMDGLAALWEELAEKFPERVSVKPNTSPAKVRVMERISASLLANYEGAEAIYRHHRVMSHKGDDDCPPCEDCAVFQSLSITAHRALDEAWGSEALDRAVEKALEE